jgi:acyl-CoA synthetase (AMP-forming)/AMP-acid ligase II
MTVTLNDYLERAGQHPDGGLRFLDRAERERWLGWAELRERAQEVRGGLQALGVRRGDRVALVFPTGPEFFAAFFGTLLAGAVPAPLYPPVRLGRLGEYLRRTARMPSCRARPARRSPSSRPISRWSSSPPAPRSIPSRWP